MWTKEQRRLYARPCERYPSDLTDAEWERLAPLIPPAKPGGRPRATDMREAMNAIQSNKIAANPAHHRKRRSRSPAFVNV